MTSSGVAALSAVTIPAQQAPQAPQQTETLLEHAMRYAEDRHWDVLPGAWLEESGGTARCACALPGCGAPGAHPMHPDWMGLATGSATALRRLWGREPRAAVLLPTGRTFDVVEVPESAGCLALARMERLGTVPGPVSHVPGPAAGGPGGRMQFFVLPGSAAKLPALLREVGWSSAGFVMTVRGEGDFVAAAPTRVGTGGPVRWVRRPTRANRWLPDVAELLAPLAYACAQEER